MESQNRQANEKGDVGNAQEDILAKIDEIYTEWEELCYKIDQENFCTDCEFIVILNEREEYWGSTCYRQVPSCRAEFNPEDGLCQRQGEYEELVEQKEAKQAELERLEALQEMLEGGERVCKGSAEII